MNKKGALISRDFRNSSFFLSLFPLFTQNSNISHVYIFVVQFANHTVRRWKFFSFSRNRVTRVGHISFFNDQRQSIEGEKRIWIEKGISFDNSISSSSQKKNPSFLPFFPYYSSFFERLPIEVSCAGYGEYTGSPDTSKQQTNAYASWHKSHRHLSLSVS